MQCYQHIAATLLIADTIDSLHGMRQYMPLNVVCAWMEENDIDADDLINQSGEHVRALVEEALHHHLLRFPRAA